MFALRLSLQKSLHEKQDEEFRLREYSSQSNESNHCFWKDRCCFPKLVEGYWSSDSLGCFGPVSRVPKSFLPNRLPDLESSALPKRGEREKIKLWPHSHFSSKANELLIHLYIAYTTTGTCTSIVLALVSSITGSTSVC